MATVGAVALVGTLPASPPSTFVRRSAWLVAVLVWACERYAWVARRIVFVDMLSMLLVSLVLFCEELLCLLLSWVCVIGVGFRGFGLSVCVVFFVGFRSFSGGSFLRWERSRVHRLFGL